MRAPEPIDDRTLAAVTGGAEPTAFGRCGPGEGMAWLGDVRTPECARHDALVGQYLAEGSSKAMAHLKASPALPAAIGSYVSVRADQLGDAVRGYFKR